MSHVFRRTDRKDPYYWIQFRDENGDRHRERISPNKRHAEEVLAKRLTEVAERKFLVRRESGRLRFKDFAEDYIKKVVPSLRWADQAERIARKWVAYFGDKRLSEISAEQIEAYRVKRSRQPRIPGSPRLTKPATINRETQVLKRMFNIARQWDLVADNPVTRLRMLPERNRRLRYLTADECGRLVAAAAPHLRPFLIVALNTGARRGELFGLRWRDVDLDARVMSFVDTKNGKRRDIRINETVCEVLRKLPRRGEFVFTATGTKLTSIVHAFKTACKRAGIVDFRIHDLRHTFASHAMMAGIDIGTLQQLLGHSSPTMTMRYSHLAPEHTMRAVEKVKLGKPSDAGEVREPRVRLIPTRRRGLVLVKTPPAERKGRASAR